MKIQELVSDVRSRVESASRPYQGALKAYINTQREAVGVMTRNSRTLAGTEIGAAKNVFASAKASFDKARTDGVRKVARNPQTYVPNGSAQVVSAYKDTLDVMVRTGNELSTVVSTGYKSVLDNLVNAPTQSSEKSTTTASAKNATPAKRVSNKADKSSTAAKTAKTDAKSTAAKRKTAATRKTTTGTAKQSKSNATDGAKTGTASHNTSNTTDGTTTAGSSDAS